MVGNEQVPPAQAYADHGAIKDLLLRKRGEWAKGREPFVRAAYRNILFYRGIQWIKWDRTINRWRPARLPKNVPTPVTNIFASTMDALISVFARVEPTLNFRPGSPDEPDDRATSDVAIRAIQVVEDEVDLRINRQILATWIGLTGEAWLETGYDPDPIYGTRTLQHEQCPACGAVQPPGAPQCTACGTPGLIPATDETGAPVGELVPIGKMYVDVANIFEMFYDHSEADWGKQRAYLREKSVSEERAKARWPHLADVIKANVIADGESWYADSLAVVGPQIEEAQVGRLAQAGAARPMNTRVTEQWFWQLPDATYPEGLLAVLVGKQQVAYAGPLPYAVRSPTGDRQPFLPHIKFVQKFVPGTGHGKTVADDLALKQSQRNRWESIVEACGMRMGSPVWLKPMGANVTNLTGDPGNIIGYTAIGPGAAKPERIPGQGIPLSFIHMIRDIDKNFEELAATFDVVKGARPEGVSAGIALQILQERGLSRYGPLFIMWEAMWAKWARQALEIFREFVTEPRLLKIKGRDGMWQVEKFMGADLRGNIDVVPEAASSAPRSSLLDRAEMEQLASMRVIDLTDPEIRWKFLEVYGRTNLTPAMAADTRNAIRENEAFAKLAQNPQVVQALGPNTQMFRVLPYHQLMEELTLQGIKLPRVRPAVDDHSIHIREMRTWLKLESTQQLPEIIQILAERHLEYHQELAMLQAQTLQGGMPVLPTPGGYFQATQTGGGGGRSALNTSSSPQRLMGEGDELTSDVAAGTSP